MMMEKLARAVHELFCEEMRAGGYTYGPVTDDAQKKHNALVPYDRLPEEFKEQNRANARDIQNKLASAGYKMVRAAKDSVFREFTPAELEDLAILEHQRYVNQKLADGWRYAPVTDRAKKLHNGLLPWEQLSEEDKFKDRILVKGIPQILKKAGYVMVKKPSP